MRNGVDFIDSFFEGAREVFKDFDLGGVEKGETRVKKRIESDGSVIGIITLLHAIKGHVILSMEFDDAKRLATKILPEISEADEDFMDLVESSVSEILNMISGRGLSGLLKMGLTVDISQPTIVVGKGKIQFNSATIAEVELKTEFGNIELDVCAEEY